MKNVIFSVILLIVVAQVLVFSQVKDSTSVYEVRVQASTSDTRVPLNRSVKLILQISWAGTMDTVTVENIEDPVLTNFEITGTSAANRIEASAQGKKSVREITYNLKPKGLGMGYIEPVSVTYLEKSTGKSYKVTTRRFGIKVTDAVPDPEERKFPYVWLIALVLLSLGGTVYYMVRRKNASDDDENMEEQAPAEEECLLELKNIIRGKTEDADTILTSLLRSFRQYLSREFGIGAMEATSSEVIRLLEETEMEESFLKRFDKIFSRADVVKFSGEKASQADIDDAFAVMEMFLEKRLKLKQDKISEKQSEHKKKFNLLNRKKTE